MLQALLNTSIEMAKLRRLRKSFRWNWRNGWTRPREGSWKIF